MILMIQLSCVQSRRITWELPGDAVVSSLQVSLSTVYITFLIRELVGWFVVRDMVSKYIAL